VNFLKLWHKALKAGVVKQLSDMAIANLYHYFNQKIQNYTNTI